MRFEVGTINRISRVAFLGAGLVLGATMLRAGGGGAPAAIHAVAAYGLTFLAFAAFPRTRRSDLVKIVVAVAVVLEAARRLMGLPAQATDVICDVAGALAVHLPSFMERFRSLTRADPHEPFSMVYPHDRRRRRKSPAAAPAAS